MKNILTTAGMAAVAVVGFQTTCAAQTVTVDDSKWWQVSAALRGFYDDNYNAAPKRLEQDSFGVEIRPGFEVGHEGEQHLIKLSGIYSARWFDDRPDEEWDHTFLIDLAGEYRLNENHVIRVTDSFAYTSEDTLLDQGGPVTATTLRSDGSNMKNLGDLSWVGQFTPLFGLEVGYQNTYYDYDEDGPFSYSALLDRMEQIIRGETRWTITPTLAGILGYWYELVEFNGDEVIGGTLANPIFSDARDSDSHFLVTGADYTVSPHCFVSVRGGAQNVSYDAANADDEWNAFGDVNATFEYLEGSYFRVGGKYGRNRTDVVSALDQETFTAYGLVNHKITENLSARGSGQFQWGEFEGIEGVGADGEDEGLYILGISLIYDLTQHLALETGYNYDRLDSDNGFRTYTRNRVFLGVRGQF